MISKKILSTLLVSLFALSMFTFMIPFGHAASYTLTVEAAVHGPNTVTSWEKSVRLGPEEENLQDIEGIHVYLTDYCDPGGLSKKTPAKYIQLEEGANKEIKVPLTVVNGQYLLLFEHWEVWDQDGTPELDWINGRGETHQYPGSWTRDGVTYTRITKLIANPKNARTIRIKIEHNLEAKYQASSKELLMSESITQKPYLNFGIKNPPDGENKTLIAVYHRHWGPKNEHLYFKTILSPDAALDAFLIGDVDAMTDLIRTSDIDTLDDFGAVITSIPGFHMCYIGSNLRLPWMGPQDGGEPGASLRKACAHLLPKDTLIATLFRYIVVRLDSFVPPGLEEWYNPDVTIYDYNPVAAYNTLVAGGWEYSEDYGTWWHPDTGVVAGGDDRSIEMICPLEVVAPTSFTIGGRYVEEMNALTNPATGDPTPLKASRAAIDFWTIVLRAFLYRDFEQYFLCWGDLSEDSIYFIFHSSWDIPWGDNAWGLHNPEVDELLEIVEFGTDHDAKVQAHKDVQALLSTILPIIPIYSRNYFSAHQPDYYGMVLVPGEGIDNGWTWLNVKGPRESPTFKPPLTQVQGNETIWQLGEACESYNPSEAGSVYAWTVLETMYDGLIGENPYTLKDKPWLAKDWNPVFVDGEMTTPNGYTIVDGMYVEYILDDRVVAGDVRWHDGEVFDANDIMFSWRYVWDNELTNWFGFHETLVDIDNPSPDKVVAYWDEQSQWLQYDGAGMSALYAPQVWGKIDTDGDGDNYLDDGDIEGDMSIRSYQPEDHDRSELGSYPAQAAFPWLSQAIGQGPWVLYDASEDGYHSNLFAFDTRSHQTLNLDIHYWKTIGEIVYQKVEMFYHIGDISLDAIVDTLDLARMGLHLFETGTTYPSGDYRGFIQEDVKEDGVINILDLATAGKNFGKEKEY